MKKIFLLTVLLQFVIFANAQLTINLDNVIPENERAEGVTTFVTSDGKFLISANSSFINKWSLETEDFTQVIITPSIPNNYCIVDVTNDGNFIAYMSKDNKEFIVIETKNGEIFKKYRAPENESLKGLMFSTNEFLSYHVICAYESDVFYLTYLSKDAKKDIKIAIDLKFGRYLNAFVKLPWIFSFYKNSINVTDQTKNTKFLTGGIKNFLPVYKIGMSDWKFYIVAENKGLYSTYVKKVSDKKPVLLADWHEFKTIPELDNVNDLQKYILVGEQRNNLFYYVNKETGAFHLSFDKIINPSYIVYSAGETAIVKNLERKYYLMLQQNSNGEWFLHKDDGTKLSFYASKNIVNKSDLKYHILSSNYNSKLLLNEDKNTLDPLRVLQFIELALYNKNKNVLLLNIDNFLKLNIANPEEYKTKFLTNEEFNNIIKSKCKEIIINNEKWYGNDNLQLRLKNNLIELRFIDFYAIENGNIYRGTFLSKTKFEGIIKKPDGFTYRGTFINDKLEGEGDIFKDLYSLHGTFKNGNLLKGNIKYFNGDKATGVFVNNQLNGKGVFSFQSGAEYNGDFLNNNFHGKGKLVFDDGGYYEGEFNNNQFHGQGKLNNPSTGERYEGEFKNGQMHGSGIYWNNGQPERCEFYEGQRIDQVYLIAKENKRAELQRQYELLQEQERQRKIAEDMARYESQQKGPSGLFKAFMFTMPLAMGAALGVDTKSLVNVAASSFTDVYLKGDYTLSGTASTIQSMGGSASGTINTGNNSSISEADKKAALSACNMAGRKYSDLMNKSTDALEKFATGQSSSLQANNEGAINGVTSQLCAPCAMLESLICQYNALMRIGAREDAQKLLPNINKYKSEIRAHPANVLPLDCGSLLNQP